MTPWSPLAGGVLSGKYTRDNSAPEDAGRARMAAGRLNEDTHTVLDTLRRISAEHGTTVAAAALAWVRQRLPSRSFHRR